MPEAVSGYVWPATSAVIVGAMATRVGAPATTFTSTRCTTGARPACTADTVATTVPGAPAFTHPERSTLPSKL